MFTLLFLVCNTVTGECYSAASNTIYRSVNDCTADAIMVMERNYALQAEGKGPPERAIFACYNWGSEA